MRSETLNALLHTRQAIREYDAGVSIFREGDCPQGVFFIRAGEVRLTYGLRTEQRPMRVAAAGDILALGPLATQCRLDCSATAMSPCTIGFVDRADFMTAVQASAAIWFEVLHLLSGELNTAYDELRRVHARRKSA